MAGSTKYHMKMQAVLSNIDQLEPKDCLEDENLRCERCHVVTKSEVAAKLGLKDHRLPGGGLCNMSYSCKNCDNKGFVDMLGGGRPLTIAKPNVTIMVLQAWALSP